VAVVVVALVVHQVAAHLVTVAVQVVVQVDHLRQLAVEEVLELLAKVIMVVEVADQLVHD
jgi:hypothetical protein